MNYETLVTERARREVVDRWTGKDLDEPMLNRITRTVCLEAIPAVTAGVIAGITGGLETAIHTALHISMITVPLGIVFNSLTFKFKDNYTLRKAMRSYYDKLIEGENNESTLKKAAPGSMIANGLFYGGLGLFFKGSGLSFVAGGIATGGFEAIRSYRKRKKIKLDYGETAKRMYSEVEKEKWEAKEAEREKAERESRGEFKNFDAYKDYINRMKKEFEDSHMNSDQYFNRMRDEFKRIKEEFELGQHIPSRKRSELSCTQAFQILKIDTSQNYETARKAYRIEVRRVYPMINRGDKKAEEEFKTLSRAWAVVEDFYKAKQGGVIS